MRVPAKGAHVPRLGRAAPRGTCSRRGLACGRLPRRCAFPPRPPHRAASGALPAVRSRPARQASWSRAASALAAVHAGGGERRGEGRGGEFTGKGEAPAAVWCHVCSTDLCHVCSTDLFLPAVVARVARGVGRRRVCVRVRVCRRAAAAALRGSGRGEGVRGLASRSPLRTARHVWQEGTWCAAGGASGGAALYDGRRLRMSSTDRSLSEVGSADAMSALLPRERLLAWSSHGMGEGV